MIFAQKQGPLKKRMSPSDQVIKSLRSTKSFTSCLEKQQTTATCSGTHYPQSPCRAVRERRGMKRATSALETLGSAGPRTATADWSVAVSFTQTCGQEGPLKPNTQRLSQLSPHQQSCSLPFQMALPRSAASFDRSDLYSGGDQPCSAVDTSAVIIHLCRGMKTSSTIDTIHNGLFCLDRRSRSYRWSPSSILGR